MSRVPTSFERSARQAILIIFLAISFGVVTVAILVPKNASSQAGVLPLTGWLWSSNVGWISLNCSTGSPSGGNMCSTINYGVNVDGSGNLSGFAWSDNVGWVDFNALSGCPSTQTGNTSCQPTLKSNAFNGWVRACAGTLAGDCTGASRTDGWDGWISLWGTAPVAYGPIVDSSGNMSGFAWDSGVLGWIQFRGKAPISCLVPPDPPRCGVAASGENPLAVYDSTTNAICGTVCAYSCSAGACVTPHASCAIPDGNGGTVCLTVRPSIVPPNGQVTVTWDVNDVKDNGGSPACSVTSSPAGNSWTSNASTIDPFTSSGSQPSAAITTQTTFTLSCLGIDDVRNTWSVTVAPPPSFQER